MIKAVIFDMDGLLVDSEPIWRRTEIALFKPLGVPLDEAMTYQTTGLRADEVVRYWHHRYPWDGPTQEAVSNRLIDAMVKALSDTSVDIALPGITQAFEVIQRAGLPIAIASSSPLRLIEAATKNLGITDKLQTIQSAEHEQYGKPHPAVYIKAAGKLGVAPEQCLAFEDSINGVLAAKAAKMRCIAIPEAGLRDHKAYGIADMVLATLDEFNNAILRDIAKL